VNCQRYLVVGSIIHIELKVPLLSTVYEFEYIYMYVCVCVCVCVYVSVLQKNLMGIYMYIIQILILCLEEVLSAQCV